MRLNVDWAFGKANRKRETEKKYDVYTAYLYIFICKNCKSFGLQPFLHIKTIEKRKIQFRLYK